MGANHKKSGVKIRLSVPVIARDMTRIRFVFFRIV
ncbi:hypothetical protein CGLO_12482 [Colletotrichum gloeosporioides Cg-14]|uniref:Uncharacterized protein n=1 Tax=Colletotrichum gloeosporioides (strain Cg-14) TaxID=1237896 RepID=T0K5R0_COLGC|nr:hypothetical protein CGLO_12482 [Colletotrichum gloeosporioides Cg-14]